MPVLHEVIAVKDALAKTATSLMQETITTFSKRTEHFRGESKKLTMHDDERKEENTFTENEVTTTVDEKLAHLWPAIIRSIDAVASIELTNSQAKSDLVVDGKVILPDVPVTVLLALEKQLEKLIDVYNHIPTLDPSVDWELDANSERLIYKAPEIKTMRTEKVLDTMVMYEATKEHPAQVQNFQKDVVIGSYLTTKVSGMLTPKRKAERIMRIQQLHRAAIKARQRANLETVQRKDIGDIIREFIDD